MQEREREEEQEEAEGARVRSLIEDANRRLRHEIYTGIESLLQQWSASHASHLPEIRRVIDGETSGMVDRFTCFHCHETLTLEHTYEFQGTEIEWTVTPSVAKNR